MLTCSVLNCERPRRTHKSLLCNAHYFRQWRTGELGLEPIKQYGLNVNAVCSVDGCDAPAHLRLLCMKHYSSMVRYGCLESPGHHTPSGKLNPAWRDDDDVNYGRAHGRVVSVRDKASMHRCAHCGQCAKQWAYDRDHPDPDVKYEQGAPYSLNSDAYIPLCVSCHKKMDLRYTMIRNENRC